MRVCAVITFDQRMAGPLESALVRITRRAGRLCFAALGPAIFFLDTRIDLFAVDLHFGWSFDPELHLARTDFEHSDLDRITDPDVLA